MRFRQLTPRAIATQIALSFLSCPDAACQGAPTTEVTVAAATSLREVMPALVRAYEARYPARHVSVTYGASGDLEKQVLGGAPIDAVLFAGARPVDALVAAGKVARESRRVLASNAIVLVGPRGGRPLTFATLPSLPANERLAIGDPRTVPAGEYAREYLTSLGEWDGLEDRLVLGSNVAAVLMYARRGEALAAVVYRTELRGMSDLVVLDEARGAGAPRPEVVGGTVKGGHAIAEEFIRFVASADGTKILASFGFGEP